MTVEQLGKLHVARPFRPFRIHLADGRSLEVPHPEVLAHVPGARTFVVGDPTGTYEIVDLLLVISLEVVNGRSRPRRRNS
jgi:hypothetical protein